MRTVGNFDIELIRRQAPDYFEPSKQSRISKVRYDEWAYHGDGGLFFIKSSLVYADLPGFKGLCREYEVVQAVQYRREDLEYRHRCESVAVGFETLKQARETARLLATMSPEAMNL